MPEQPKYKTPLSGPAKIKGLWPIFSFFVLALIIFGFSYWWSFMKPKNVNSESNCSQLETQIQALIDQENHCQQDSDCVVGEGFFCPFGCYSLFNKDNKEADLTKIRAEAKEYNNICPTCVYRCMIPPTAAEIKCVAGKCADTRF